MNAVDDADASSIRLNMTRHRACSSKVLSSALGGSTGAPSSFSLRDATAPSREVRARDDTSPGARTIAPSRSCGGRGWDERKVRGVMGSHGRKTRWTGRWIDGTIIGGF